MLLLTLALHTFALNSQTLSRRALLESMTQTEPIAAKLSLKGKLVISYSPSSPQEASEKLILIGSKRRTEVSFPNLLAGHVTLRDAAEALRYVRLFTTPRTAHCLGNTMGIEVRSRGSLGLDWTYGDQLLLASLKDSPNGYCGVVGDSLKPTGSVTWTGKDGHFYVRRLLMLPLPTIPSLGNLCLVVEKISADGKYRLLTKERVTTGGLSRIAWIFPSYY